MDDETIEALEIDLDIAMCGEILTAHGMKPTVPLVLDLWHWKEGAANDGT